MVFELERCAHCGTLVGGEGFWTDAPAGGGGDSAIHVIEQQYFCNDHCHLAFTAIDPGERFAPRCRLCDRPSVRVFMGGATNEDLMAAPEGTPHVRSTRFLCGHEMREVLCCRADPDEPDVLVVDCLHRVILTREAL